MFFWRTFSYHHRKMSGIKKTKKTRRDSMQNAREYVYIHPVGSKGKIMAVVVSYLFSSDMASSLDLDLSPHDNWSFLVSFPLSVFIIICFVKDLGFVLVACVIYFMIILRSVRCEDGSGWLAKKREIKPFRHAGYWINMTK